MIQLILNQFVGESGILVCLDYDLNEKEDQVDSW